MWPFCGRSPQRSAQDMKAKIQKGLGFLKDRTEDAEAKLAKEKGELAEYETSALGAITAQQYTQARITAERYLLKRRQVDAWVMTIKRYDASKHKLEDLWHTKVEEQSFMQLGKIFKGIQEVTPDTEDRDLEAAEDEHFDFDDFTREIKERVGGSIQHASMGDDIEEDEVERQLRVWGYDANTAAGAQLDSQLDHGRPEVSHEPVQVSHGLPEVAHGALEPMYAQPEVAHGPLEPMRGPPEVAHERVYESEDTSDPEDMALLASVLEPEEQAV